MDESVIQGRIKQLLSMPALRDREHEDQIRGANEILQVLNTGSSSDEGFLRGFLSLGGYLDARRPLPAAVAGKMAGKSDLKGKGIAVKPGYPLELMEPTGGIEPPTC